jgi:hypothetical protein
VIGGARQIGDMNLEGDSAFPPGLHIPEQGPDIGTFRDAG